MVCHYIATSPVIHQDQNIKVANRWFHTKGILEALNKCWRKKFFRPRLGFPKVDGMTITRGLIVAKLLAQQSRQVLEDVIGGADKLFQNYRAGAAYWVSDK